MKPDDENAAELALLAQALRNLREGLGLGQEEAGAAVRPAPMSSQAWGGYELGKVKGLMTPGVQTKLMTALGLTREDLTEERDRLAGEPARPRPTAEIRQFQPVATNHRRAVFPLSDGGEVVIQFPKNLSPQGRREMAEFLNVLVKTAPERDSG